MKTKMIALGLVAIMAISAAPLAPASAHEFYHGGWGGGYHRGHDGGLLFGLLGAGVVAAAAIVTAPVRIVAGAVAPPPVYYAPQPAAYAAYPAYGYYPRHRVVAYGYPPGYGYPAPVYAQPQVYYYGQ